MSSSSFNQSVQILNIEERNKSKKPGSFLLSEKSRIKITIEGLFYKRKGGFSVVHRDQGLDSKLV